MAEYLYNEVQTVLLNQAAIFDNSIPCNRGNVFHENGTGVFTLRGRTCNCFARYQVDFTGNIAIPTGGGTVGPIAVALAVNGEVRPTSRSIYTPAAVGDANYGNVTSTAIIDVPAGCCSTLSLRSVAASNDPAAVPAPVINVQNANLRITRIA